LISTEYRRFLVISIVILEANRMVNDHLEVLHFWLVTDDWELRYGG